MPLLHSVPLSKIGSTYLSSDATVNGEWTKVDWVDQGLRPNPIRPVVVNLDASAVVYNRNTARKGPITLVIPSCTSALREALRTAKNAGGHYTAALSHPDETVSLDVEYLRLDISDREGGAEAWKAGDPREVIVKLWSHGSAA